MFMAIDFEFLFCFIIYFYIFHFIMYSTNYEAVLPFPLFEKVINQICIALTIVSFSSSE